MGAATGSSAALRGAALAMINLFADVATAA
jgi:hypothetical protein